ncbi:hypothetical protein [Actinomadura miaoliensis]|uniref:DUF3140 domain-containing protein n=1 Tax=Actinomadura miaoliensis TaxID=430685 RepID=A0ABP7WB40_9ACTN
MSGRLVGEVIQWLRTPAAKRITAKERIVLLTVADRVQAEHTQETQRPESGDQDQGWDGKDGQRP